MEGEEREEIRFDVMGPDSMSVITPIGTASTTRW